MEDEKIIELYIARDERAISETSDKYGSFLKKLANNVLKNLSDAEECVNDTYLKAWNAIPPEIPAFFRAFLAKITRNLSLNRYESERAIKRGGGEIPEVIDELSELIPSDSDVESEVFAGELKEVIERFLGGISSDKRKVFIRRYWFMDPVSEVAKKLGMSESAVKMSLKRTRDDLKVYLEREGVMI